MVAVVAALPVAVAHPHAAHPAVAVHVVVHPVVARHPVVAAGKQALFVMYNSSCRKLQLLFF